MATFQYTRATQGQGVTLARVLRRARGITDGDFHAPTLAVANSFTQFAPGQMQLKGMSQPVVREIGAACGTEVEPP